MSRDCYSEWNSICRRAGGRRRYNGVRQFLANRRLSEVIKALKEFGFAWGSQSRIAERLGVSRSTTILRVVLSNGKAGIITGVMLSIARVAGESAPLLLTIGWTSFYPTGLSQPMSSMPVLVYQFAISPFENWHDLAWGASAFLILFVLGLNLIVRLAAHGGIRVFRRRHSA